MPPFRYRLILLDGSDLGPFISGADWLPGAIVDLPRGSFRVTAVVTAGQSEDFRAYLVVEPFDVRE